MFISAAVYVALHYIFPVQRINEFVETAPPAGVLIRSYREQWDDEAELGVERIMAETKA